MRRIKGNEGPYLTGKTHTKSVKESAVVEVEGILSDLRRLDPSDYCPSGMVVENSKVAPSGGGMGKMTINCIAYGSTDISTLPERTTWKISMQEVQKDLKMHPDCVGDRAIIEKWISTDPDKRYDENGDPQYEDSNGSLTPVTAEGAKKYIGAYEAGIESYVVHYPVVEKLSYYKTLPGCSMSGNSTTSGTVKFSANIDEFDIPAVKLQGFADTGWFKSGDDYQQRENLTWVRTEQWTWTPDGSDSDLAWIYGGGSSQGGNS